MGNTGRAEAPPPGMRPMGQMFMDDSGGMYRKTSVFDDPMFDGKTNEQKKAFMMHPVGGPFLAVKQSKFEPEYVRVGGVQSQASEENTQAGYGPAKRLDNAEQEAEMKGKNMRNSVAIFA